MIKHHDNKGRTYDVIPLDWGINNYDVYNKNGLIETVIFLLFVHSESWITLSTLVHIIPSSTTLTNGLIIGVVMAIKEIDQFTMVRSSGQIQQKSTKEGEGRYTFQWLWMKWRVVSTCCQLEVELILTEHDLDYQCVYVFCCYIYQNN
jgi:uncharacterized protein YjaG (DUF416 family)